MRAAALRLAVLDTLPPESIALTVAVGLVLGAFPIFGFPTVLCGAAALSLRLNVTAMQVMNQVSTPLQIALLAPLARVGALVIPYPEPAGLALRIGVTALQAAAGWCCVCVPLGCLLYLVLVALLRRYPRRRWTAIGGTV